MRTSLTRSQLREALSTGSGLPVMLDMRDNISTLLCKPYSGDLRDWVAAGKMVGADVNCLVGEADWLPSSHALGRRRRVIEETPGRKVVEIVQPTPRGDLTAIEIEEPGQKPARTQMFLREEADYAKAIALLRALRASRADITSHLASKRRIVGEDGLLSIFIPQPLEMHFLVLHGDMILHQLDWPDTYAAAMAEVRETSNMMPADMFFKGGLELERLLCGTPDECTAMTRSAWEAHGQRRYILAGTCAILTGTPAENLRAVTATAALCQR